MHRIGVVGVSYRHASAADIARLAIAKADIPEHLPRLRAALHGAEVCYLATCNRVEILFAEPDRPAADRRVEIFRALTGREAAAGEAAATLRTWTGEAAVEHLLLVACGLDSAQAGEQEIFTQLRAAWHTARSARVTGPLLDRIVGEALSMARNAHRLGRQNAPSLADLAVGRVAEHLAGRSAEVALLGVSPMTKRCGTRLRARNVSLCIVNRSLEPAQELANALGGRALTLDAFREAPPPLGALVCASGGSEPLLGRAELARLAGQPLIIDFGLPPNVDPSSASAAGLTRIGMDDLVRSARDERVTHLIRLAPIRAAIDERLGRLRTELAARAIGPQLAELRDTFARIAEAEMDRLLKGDLQDLDEERRARLAGWATALAHRLAHLPLSGLRAAAEHTSTEATDAFFREARLRRRDAD
jgi:glutamyl-tRNA reductase